MSHFQNENAERERKKKGVVKSAAASFMILPQKCQAALANIYRAALSAICQLTYGSIKAFHPRTDPRRSDLRREERRDGRVWGGGVNNRAAQWRRIKAAAAAQPIFSKSKL